MTLTLAPHPALKPSSCGPVPRCASCIGPDWFPSRVGESHDPYWDTPVSTPEQRQTEGDKSALCSMSNGKGQAPTLPPQATAAGVDSDKHLLLGKSIPTGSSPCPV